ncbi:MAG: acyl-CoA thioesterase [Candidatus Eisenbacteria bacterium]|nr:acyl-CoA thioesterase [Candidatus Latescibacterota bacterium]MBD3303421.1 acyl-CoA thioesterase [Candidatus Eisenbacteria bacterium]
MSAFEHALTVRFHEVDPAGIVFFGRIFGYAHDAYEAWIRTVGFPLEVPIAERGYALPLAHAEADFHSPIRGGTELRVFLEVLSIGTSSFTVRSRILGKEGMRHATVETTHVCIDPAGGRPRPIPDDFRAAIEPYRTG